MDDITHIAKSLIELGAPVIYLIQLMILWKEYRKTVYLLVQLLAEIQGLRSAHQQDKVSQSADR
ncbi:MAG: hypothetical protein D6823_08140 [Chloroflexi bacterium]|jgi:hypothetical protein|nr:MAG: hypothetical protein D6823_08140 [Chloroflexota bacterium]